jgi:hypothetical protein
MDPIPCDVSAAQAHLLLTGATQFRSPLAVQPNAVEYYLHGEVSDRLHGLPVMRDAAGKGWSMCGPFRFPFIAPGMAALEAGVLGNSRLDDRSERHTHLWIREPARVCATTDGRPAATFTDQDAQRVRLRYDADGAETDWIRYPPRLGRTKIGRHLPGGCYREAARLLIEVTAVRCERLQDLSEADAEATGVMHWAPCAGIIEPGSVPPRRLPIPARDWYVTWWDSIHGKGSWQRNPWVWVVTCAPVPHALQMAS